MCGSFRSVDTAAGRSGECDCDEHDADVWLLQLSSFGVWQRGRATSDLVPESLWMLPEERPFFLPALPCDFLRWQSFNRLSEAVLDGGISSDMELEL